VPGLDHDGVDAPGLLRVELDDLGFERAQLGGRENGSWIRAIAPLRWSRSTIGNAVENASSFTSSR